MLVCITNSQIYSTILEILVSGTWTEFLKRISILVLIQLEFDVHGSVHRNINIIEKNQQDATV
jgi:uncharacterized protein YqhQ